MRTLFVLLLGIVLGAIGYYLYQNRPVHDRFASTPAVRSSQDLANDAAAKTRSAAASVSAAISEKMQAWHLTPADIHSDLARSGQVARENVAQLREKASDARIVAVIKAKVVLDRDLSVSSLDVQSSDGSVTLTGTVRSEDLVGRAVALALDTEGVHHVTSKLTIRPKS